MPSPEGECQRVNRRRAHRQARGGRRRAGVQPGEPAPSGVMATKVYIICVIGSYSDTGEVLHPQTTKSLHVFSASPSPTGLCQCWKTSCTMQTGATTARFNPTATDGLCTSHSPAL